MADDGPITGTFKDTDTTSDNGSRGLHLQLTQNAPVQSVRELFEYDVTSFAHELRYDYVAKIYKEKRCTYFALTGIVSILPVNEDVLHQAYENFKVTAEAPTIHLQLPPPQLAAAPFGD